MHIKPQEIRRLLVEAIQSIHSRKLLCISLQLLLSVEDTLYTSQMKATPQTLLSIVFLGFLLSFCLLSLCHQLSSTPSKSPAGQCQRHKWIEPICLINFNTTEKISKEKMTVSISKFNLKILVSGPGN